MGYCEKRITKAGQPRYTAMYLDVDNKYRSAGTFDLKKDAKKAWQKAESKAHEGQGEYLVRGRMSFETYVNEHWKPNLTVEVKTLETYSYELHAHILGYFAERRMIDIRAADIRRWLTQLKQGGVSAATRKYLKTLLSTIFSNAVNDDIVPANPCLKVKTEKVAKKALRIVTPEQYDKFYAALVHDIWKLLVEVAIETGMRWGEITELRVKDFEPKQHRLRVSRAVVQVNRKFHPQGGRFLVKPPKDHEQRVLRIREGLTKRIKDHIATRNLKKEDLLFWYIPEAIEPGVVEPAPMDLGRTEPNEKGRTYQHGSMSAYTAGRCHCEHCKDAMTDYRRKRRASGKDQPRRQRRWDTDGHIPSRWFRERVIRPALAAADLPVDIRMHLLRHAHASWLLNGGATLMDVKDRLGHASILTTERYLHTVDDSGMAALDALERVRQGGHPDVEVLGSVILTGLVSQEPLNQDELAKIDSQLLFSYLGTFQAEMNRRLIQNEMKIGAAA
ncbi:tyrosine-type recombinase/integrase [Glycomyces harbinensis]|uniref:Site-specific recombinase XerD n=1 Tax=Glycomyces harbinensis TaxID=58114 RepID=A0A1G6YA89_9ACTN|nr:tyrosine-type recombinase/integrase [Glycomyces harbinensis]SDD86496.1 Site-specific recombinase XerD [Glycomyces harbinensis]